MEESLQLFASEHELPFMFGTGLFQTSDSTEGVIGSELLLQLLPYLIETAGPKGKAGSLGSVDVSGCNQRIMTKNDQVLSALQSQQKNFGDNVDKRVAFFSRSASYMGSKSALAPALTELIDAFFPADGIVVDLMCGSGAATSAFARKRPVFASDAQVFSQCLAVAQGGGMDHARAQRLIDDVLACARTQFDIVSKLIADDIAREEYFLTTELSDADRHEFIEWAREYPRIGSQTLERRVDLAHLVRAAQGGSATIPVLFVAYYANLFFGVRQAAEIDCLRSAIDQLQDPFEKRWAMGALICAVSACADNYGGHFAQPKFDVTQPDRALSGIRNTLFKRSLSVTHEFAVRFLNLATESETIQHPVQVVPGPWKEAISELGKKNLKGPVLMYLDPPYTRDEYSRYYHVLETLVAYDYPEVSGKASVPKKGQKGRFSSEFFTRTSDTVEKTISAILRDSLSHGWACLWSYSNTGMASIDGVLSLCKDLVGDVHIFEAKYAYRAQGRQLSKKVSEYMIYIAPNTPSY